VQNNISGKYEKLQKRLPNILRTRKVRGVPFYQNREDERLDDTINSSGKQNFAGGM